MNQHPLPSPNTLAALLTVLIGTERDSLRCQISKVQNQLDWLTDTLACVERLAAAAPALAQLAGQHPDRRGLGALEELLRAVAPEALGLRAEYLDLNLAAAFLEEGLEKSGTCIPG